MELSYPVQRFIEDNIVNIEQGKWAELFYYAMFALTSPQSAELFSVVDEVLNIDPSSAIEDALIMWCKDNVALRYDRKVAVSKVMQNIPHFGLGYATLRLMFYAAVKTAYPNKTVLPDSYGIEYVVEKK